MIAVESMNILIDVIFNFFTSATEVHQWLLKSPKLAHKDFASNR
jgi:hypothetical protein